MFKKTEYRKNRARAKVVWLWKSFRTDNRRISSMQTSVLKHLYTLTKSVDEDLENLNNDYVRLVDAVEFTIFERLHRITLKAKAFEKLVRESRINGEWRFDSHEGREKSIKLACRDMIGKIYYMSLNLSEKYEDIITKILGDDKNLHWSKVAEYMPVPKEHNYLDLLCNTLLNAPSILQEEVCRSCGWSINTFFARRRNRVTLRKRRVLNHPFTEAESEKIISIFMESVMPIFLAIIKSWQDELEMQRKADINLKNIN